MHGHRPDLLYTDNGPRLLHSMYVIAFVVVIIGLRGLLLGDFRSSNPLADQLLFAFAVPLSILLSILIPLALLISRKCYIFTTGVMPSYRTLRMLFRPDHYFIRYGDIEMIGYHGPDPEHPLSYTFLMRGGFLAFCTTPEKEEGIRILANQLRKNCPNVQVVQLALPTTFPGIRPKEMIRMMYGANAPVRYFAPP